MVLEAQPVRHRIQLDLILQEVLPPSGPFAALQALMRTSATDCLSASPQVGGPRFRPLTDPKEVAAISAALQSQLPIPMRRLLTILDLVHRADPEHSPRDT